MLVNLGKKIHCLMMVLTMTAAGSANAGDTEVIQGKDYQIITDNFALDMRGSASSDTKADRTTLGSVGAYDVVPGTRAQDHIAFVKKSRGTSYIIQNRIIVKCSRRTGCVIPPELNAVKLSSRLYEVQVADYASWKTQMTELKKIPGVIKVSGTYTYGLKPDLK